MTTYVAYTFPGRGERIQLMVLAFAVHLIVLGLLVFGISFKHNPPEANVVALWQALPDEPTPPKPMPALPPPSPPAVEPPPAPKPVKAAPPPEPKLEKPDIAFKDKKVADKKKPPEDKKLAQKQKQEIEAQQIAQEKADEQKRQQEAARNKLRDEYVGKIRDRIKRFIVQPPNLEGNPEAQFDVTLLPGGNVLSARLVQSSGVSAYDDAIERAILKAQPLPLPDDPTMFNDFRELNLTFRPQE